MPSILPDLPIDDPQYAKTFQNNYETVKLPIIKRYMNNDFLVFRMGISKYYRTEPEKGKEILRKMTDLFQEYNQDSYTCMDYLEFIGKLVYIAENEDIKNNKNFLGTSIATFKELTTTDYKQVLPFPLHTRHIDFDGIYGEATITAGIIIGMWPIMYVSRPDAIADEFLHGPIQTTWHDLQAHYRLFMTNPIFFMDMPDFIINHPKIDNDLVKYLFDIFHELSMHFIHLTFDREDLYPFYLNLINYVIRTVSSLVPKYKDIKIIDYESLISIINDMRNGTMKGSAVFDILNFYILGPKEDIMSMTPSGDLGFNNHDRLLIELLFIGKSKEEVLQIDKERKKDHPERTSD